jgi:hypothetical protein
VNDNKRYSSEEQPEKCPGCGSEKVALILWGLPAYSDELQREMDAGKIVLGGCCVSADDPSWTCIDCGARIHKDYTGSEEDLSEFDRWRMGL